MPRSIRWTVVTLAIACSVVPAGAVGASRGGGGDHGRPSASADLGELLADSWEAVLALPADRNPLLGDGDPCTMLRRHVLSPQLSGPGLDVTCTVRPRTRVFFVGVSAECSDVEEPPFLAVGEAAQQQCARANDEPTTSVLVTLDGRAFELRRPRFEIFGPQREIKLPEGNILTGTAGTATFSSHGWAVLTRPLRPGGHVISLTVAGSSPGISTVRINVAGRKRRDQR